MIDTSRCEDYFQSVQEFAKEVNMEDNLKKKLKFLDTYADHNNEGLTQCLLFKDFAPQSFTFMMQRKNKNTGEYENWFNGGLIFSGPHDNGGDGGAPTFSVNLTPTHGWSVHT